MQNIEKSAIQPSESVHSVGGVNRDTGKKEKEKNKKRKRDPEEKEAAKEYDSVEISGNGENAVAPRVRRLNRQQRDVVNKKGSQIDIVIE